MTDICRIPCHQLYHPKERKLLWYIMKYKTLFCVRSLRFFSPHLCFLLLHLFSFDWKDDWHPNVFVNTKCGKSEKIGLKLSKLIRFHWISIDFLNIIHNIKHHWLMFQFSFLFLLLFSFSNIDFSFSLSPWINYL